MATGGRYLIYVSFDSAEALHLQYMFEKKLV